MYEGILANTHRLVDNMMTAVGLRTYLTLLVATSNKDVLGLSKNWAGGSPVGFPLDPASHEGPMKALTLLHKLDGFPIAWTPIPGFELGTEYRGGVRLKVDREFHHIASASGLSQQCDAMIACIAIEALSWETIFHHVGYRHPTREWMLRQVKRDATRLGVQPVHIPAEDHDRYYLFVRRDDHPRGGWWIEHQYFPSGPYDYAVHLDVATTHDPLNLMSRVMADSPDTWKAGPNDPYGCMWARNEDGVPLGVMVRDHWWNVPIV